MAQQPTVQLGEICLRLEVRERDARYVLEQGHIPKGVDGAPDSGNYRQFGPGQAFWLGMVLKLKAIGIQTPLAAKIANDAEESLRTVTQNLGWDWRFRPLAGSFDTAHQYYVDVGDLKYIRIVTDANPSRAGRLQEFPWRAAEVPHQATKNVHPCAVIRLDLTQIARLLAGAFKIAEVD